MTAVEQSQITRRGWIARGLVAILLLIAAAGHLEYLGSAAMNGILAEGASYGPSTIAAPQWQRIVILVPGGSAERAGLLVGDDIHFDQPFATQAPHLAGEAMAATVSRGGQRFRTTLVAEPSARGLLSDQLAQLASAVSLAVIGFCALLLIRGGRARAALLLSAILALMHMGHAPTLWLPASFGAGCFYAMRLLGNPIISYALPNFCLEISGGAPTVRVAKQVHGAALVFSALGLYGSLSGNVTAPLPGAGFALESLTVIGTTIVACWALILNYRRADAATRNRIWIVAIAFLCFAVRGVLSAVTAPPESAGQASLQQWLVIVAMFGSEIAAVLLLVYAVLRQRLFDLSFAINRTLIYGAVSFTLLATFGLAEWGADRLVPESWHRQSALYSAGIALLLFLSFHRLRDWFERHVERLFFAGWQRAQADLKRFVASAGHFRQAPALCREFVIEVERFAQGAPAVLYLREDGFGFARQCGSLAAEPNYAEEDRAFALLGAERAPVDLAEAHSALPASMAFPMFDQLGLAGFVLLASRPDGAHYRPDEIDNLAWATHQVGLDLQALQARELREEVAALRQQLAVRRRRPPKLATISETATG